MAGPMRDHAHPDLDERVAPDLSIHAHAGQDDQVVTPSDPIRPSRAAAALGRRAALALVRRLLDHPHEIDRLDASAASLWPANREEAEPPRWRLDLPPAPRARIDAAERHLQPARRPIACVSATSEVCR